MADDSGRLRTLIVDDKPLAVERMQIVCARIPRLQLVGTASEGEAALRLVEALEPDLIILDIAMPGMSGIDVANALDARGGKRPAVVFVTAFDQFAVAAFDAAAVDYLLKPVAPERLEKAVERVAEQLAARAASPVAQSSAESAYAQEFWVPNRGELVRVSASAIARVEAERDYMRLHVREGDAARSYLVHETISALEQRLDPALFIRLHRSSIVRRDLIERLGHDGQGNWAADLGSGTQVKIGRTYLASVRASITRAG